MSNPFVYKEYIPANARVVVDYTAPPKDRVKFSYPRKYTQKQALRKAGWMTCINVLMITLLAGSVLVMLYGGIMVVITPSVAQQVSSSFFSMPSFSWSTFWTSLTTGYYIASPASSTYIQPPIYGIEDIIAAICILCIGAGSFVRYLETHPEYASNYIPKANYIVAKTLMSIRKIEVLPENMVDNIFVIPVFSNVYLDYKSTGEFSDYLDKVEVLEIPRNYMYRNKKGLRKPRINEYDFRCVFYFKKKPKTGSLKIDYH